LAPNDVRPLLRKDLLAFVRDPAQWGQVFLLGGVGVLYIVNASALGDGLVLVSPPMRGMVLVAAHTGIIGFIAGGLAARFAFPQVGLEGPAVWILDSAPLRPRRLLFSKWLASFPIVVFFPAVLAVVGGVLLDFSPLRTLWSALVITGFAVGVAGLAVFRGAQHPLFDAVSLSELAMGPGAVSTMILATSLAFVLSIASFAAAGLFSWRDVTGIGGVVVGLLVLLLPLATTARAARTSFVRGAAALFERQVDNAGGDARAPAGDGGLDAAG